ncbi:hypothetical protein BCON_0012g00090 [Botryotinia convoluta]|uniref:Uncharacterized protein n=1 Tax=Botryotinia convoluta TaxID=54673 RepID=A0A4Z1IVV4_9HELO|nr:hypothetical protein BCON_0012g00090 [Botryotinia convoluta]
MSSVHLDTTLEELYGLDKEDPRKIYLSYTIPTATLQTTQGIPISQKYTLKTSKFKRESLLKWFRNSSVSLQGT